MKLRIRGNSIRLRLTRAEVATLTVRGEVAEKIEFGIGNALGYRLGTSETATECHAVLGEHGIAVFLPSSVASQWANSDQISIEADQALSAGQSLRILIEKDFACLVDRPGEDDSDAFPNPDGC